MSKFRVLVVLLIGVIAGCVGDPHPAGTVVNAPVEKSAERGTVEEVQQGFAYVSLNIDGRPAEHVQEILDALKKFSQEHPKQKIICWTIEKQQETEGTSDHIFGVWITYDVDPQTATPKG